jgi:hypothetical protein
MKMTGMKVTLKSTNVTKEVYIKSKISAIMKTIIVKYIKILNMLDFLFSESIGDIAHIAYPLLTI